MQNLLAICFLATFIATGASLSCEVCEGIGDTCEGPLHTCPPGFDTCGIIQEEAKMGILVKMTVKTCFPASVCEEGLTVINLGKVGTTVKKVTCCVGNECMRVLPALPPIDTALNGKRCPACYSVHGLACQEEIAQCAGDEQYCFDLAGTVTVGGMTMTVIMKGCTNHAACNDTLHGSGAFAGISVVATANCTLASGTASFVPEFTGLFFQAFAGILLGKIFSRLALG
uniref:phospholipase A2 inhibitor gamma subunit B-like n=1 Tax=Euleptes europaea TaxID=460621 RepID=UPI00253FC85F|nr:phospholipase A2 inhibitor gamma subunit B-like [Euleptes europaea]